MTMLRHFCLPHCEKKLPFCVPEKHRVTYAHTDKHTLPSNPRLKFWLQSAEASISPNRCYEKTVQRCVSVCVCVCSPTRVSSDWFPKVQGKMTISATSQYITQFICINVTALSPNVFLHISKPVYDINDYLFAGTKKELNGSSHSQSACPCLMSLFTLVMYIRTLP